MAIKKTISLLVGFNSDRDVVRNFPLRSVQSHAIRWTRKVIYLLMPVSAIINTREKKKRIRTRTSHQSYKEWENLLVRFQPKVTGNLVDFSFSSFFYF